MLITAIAVSVLIFASSIQIFTNTASAGPKQLQQQLTTFGNNTNNTIGNENMLLSSPSSTVNIRPKHSDRFQSKCNRSNNI